MKDVLPASSVPKPFWRASSVSVSMEDVASSKIKILGSAKSALAKEMSCL